MDAHTLNAWTRFALQKGGIGACTALIDNPATEPEDLMFMAGEKIIVLRRLDDDETSARPTSSTSTSLDNKRRSDAVPDSEAWFLVSIPGSLPVSGRLLDVGPDILLFRQRSRGDRDNDKLIIDSLRLVFCSSAMY